MAHKRPFRYAAIDIPRSERWRIADLRAYRDHSLRIPVTIPLSDQGICMSWEGSDRSTRLPRDWPARCARVMALHRAVCHVCGMPGADQVDHVRPGDDHSLSNLAPIHEDPCHRAKSAHEGVAARASLRGMRTRPTEQHPGQVDHS